MEKLKVNLEMDLLPSQKTKEWLHQQKKIYDKVFYLMRYVAGFTGEEYKEVKKRLNKGLKFCEDFSEGKVDEKGDEIKLI